MRAGGARKGEQVHLVTQTPGAVETPHVHPLAAMGTRGGNRGQPMLAMYPLRNLSWQWMNKFRRNSSKGGILLRRHSPRGVRLTKS
ncbi:hypothetical protein AAC03nite_24940 [Alicyclobacillus acidoterrestris]|nr:hypothetical protein AAC03nite_24940 [Alicyclobacillus acidoterrestris]